VVSFAIAMIFAFLYYILFAIAHAMAAKGVLPPYVSMWLPNLLLVAIGLFAVRKAILV
jgi:lipopolysaccharide export system permease protein